MDIVAGYTGNLAIVRQGKVGWDLDLFTWSYVKWMHVTFVEQVSMASSANECDWTSQSSPVLLGRRVALDAIELGMGVFAQ